MSDENVIGFYTNHLSKKNLDSFKILNNNDVLNYFVKDGTQENKYPGALFTSFNEQVNTKKVTQTFLKFLKLKNNKYALYESRW